LRRPHLGGAQSPCRCRSRLERHHTDDSQHHIAFRPRPFSAIVQLANVEAVNAVVDKRSEEHTANFAELHKRFSNNPREFLGEM
jgi:hypothetical protein